MMMPGLARLMEEVATGAPPPGLADDLWRLAYTRGHVDIDRARPYLDRDHAGILVYARSLDETRALLIVETGDRLVGAAGAFGPLPRAGSAVRLAAVVAGTSAAWRLIVDEAFPLALDVRFDRAPACEGDRRWVGMLRHALGVIRKAEGERRAAIAVRRRALPPFAMNAASFEEAARERVAALRRDVERETDYTPDEAAQLDAARGARHGRGYAEQRRAFARETALVRARQERFDTRMRAALDAFRADLPALRRSIRTAQAANDATQSMLQQLEDMYVESRARTKATFTASRWLDELADAPFAIAGLESPPRGLDDPARANDVLRAVALLARALPRAHARIAV
ncbi:MAG: hypothetical protein QOJ39_1102 [Candidatus Eremiobacteraeota bacterium]|nr:hypothetical protein [Candidatus Eremiobacteraeota bacterium]